MAEIHHPGNDRLLTELDVSTLLNLSPKTLQRWRWSGRGPAWIKLAGGAVRYAEVDLHAFIDAGRRHSTSDPGSGTTK